MELLSKYSAEIIAICALVTTIGHAFIQRRHNRISVKPHLFLFTKQDGTDEKSRLRVLLINNGLGPAFINKFQVLLKGKECDLEVAIKSILGTLAENSSHTILAEDHAMSNKEVEVLLAFLYDATNLKEIKATEEKISELNLLIEYSSAYGEKFVYDSRKIRLDLIKKGQLPNTLLK